VSGVVVVKSNSSVSHNGIQLRLHGEVTLQLSAKSVGLFEAFYSSLKPVQLCDYVVTVAKSGRLPKGTTALPFEFELRSSNKDAELYETYHGVFVNVQYMLTCDMTRGVFAKDLQKKLEFIVESVVGFLRMLDVCVCVLAFAVGCGHVELLSSSSLCSAWYANTRLPSGVCLRVFVFFSFSCWCVQ
jgi:Vacuolar protein sorting-associated protein 26